MKHLFFLVLAFGIVIHAIAETSTSSPQPCTQRIYVATNGIGSGLVVSTDGGKTWLDRNPAPGTRAIYSIYGHDNNILVGTYNGVATTWNGGRTWGFFSNNYIVSSVFTISNRAFASATRSSTYALYSNDSGQTWPNEVQFYYNNGHASAVYAVGNRSFVGVNNTGDGGGVYMSDNDGKTWRVVDAASGLGSYLVTAISGFGDNVFVGLDRDGGYLSISEDRGETWGTQSTIPLGQRVRHGVKSIFASAGTVYVGTNGAGLAVSNDWWNKWRVITSSSNGLISNTINTVGVVGNTIAVGTPVGLSISNDGGSTWANITTAHGLPHKNVTAVFVQCI